MPFKYEKTPFKKFHEQARFCIENINPLVEKYDYDKFNIYFRKTILKKKIMCDAGIFLIDKTGVKQISHIDKEIKKIELKHENELESMVVNGFLDKSKEKPDKQIFQIPYEHIVVDESIDIYSINPKSNVKMHIVKDNISNNIVDIYFELDDDIEHKYIIDDIFTFLYLFN